MELTELAVLMVHLERKVLVELMEAAEQVVPMAQVAVVGLAV
jgi:hypothetical protein